MPIDTSTTPDAAEPAQPGIAEDQQPEASEQEAETIAEAPTAAKVNAQKPKNRTKVRRIFGAALTAAAAILVYLAMVVPDTVTHHAVGAFMPGAFLRVPVEAILGGAILLAVPGRLRRLAAVLLGLGLGGLTVLKVINAGFLAVLGRRFNPVLDWSLFHDGYNALHESNGGATATAAAVGAVVLSLAVIVLITLAVVRLSRLSARFARPARRTLVGLAAVWFALALTGVTIYPNNPVAAYSAAKLIKTTAKQVPAAIHDEKAFAKEAENDPYKNVPAKERLAGLAGKDFVVDVIESYGRQALKDPAMSAIVKPTLTAGTQQLAARGYYAKSGWLTSSTFGGGSWFAHASFQSGLWINNQARYNQLTASDRLTLTSAFHDAGWQTYGYEPGNTVAWPEAKFYGYDNVYDSRNMGYQGPHFGWSTMPDQYTLDQFQKDVYGKPHQPLMAEITMTSSHEPWTQIPQTVDWNQVGDGSIYSAMARGTKSQKALWSNAKETQAAYAKSISYSVGSLISWVQKYGDDNLVLVFFGDHQPWSIVSGTGGNHDVPITVVAHDKTVLDKIANWNWTDGLEPAANAPVWPMDSFRDKFFAAYGSEPAPQQAR